MKIRQLRFKNLNSLAGEWAIDFTVSEYESEGIFAITGPTGSGKSTILDAICLALYGQTPRLGKITTSSNEIMSRHTGECFAELHFATAQGEFVAHWSQHRSHDKADGKLQSPKHEIADASNGKILESMLSKVGKVIEDVCGMDFERFTRSSLLAQGSFARFLESSANERAPILEQITGTGIYSQLSILVHERKTAEDAKRQSLKDQLDGVVLLSDEEREKIEAEQKSATEILGQVKKQLGVMQEAENWLVSCQKEAENVENLKTSLEKQIEKLAAFSPQAQRLVAAQKAREVAVPFEKVTRLRSEVKKSKIDLKSLESDLVAQEKAAKKSAERSALFSENLRKAKAELSAVEPDIDRAKNHCLSLAEKEKQLAKEEADFKILDRKIQVEKTQIGKLKKSLETGENEQAQSQKFLVENASLAGLNSAFSGLVARLESRQKEAVANTKTALALVKLKEELSSFLAEKEKLAEKIVAAHKAQKVRKSDFENQEKKRADFLAERTLSEIETDLEKCEKQLDLERKIVSLSAERAKLVAGEFCPLCGSLDHPFSEGNLATHVQLSATEQAVSELKNLLKNLAETEKAAAICQLALEKSDADLRLLNGEEKNLEAKIAEGKNRVGEVAADHEETQRKLTKEYAEISERLRHFGLAETSLAAFENTSHILQELESKRDEWQAHHEKSRLWSQEKIAFLQELKHAESALAERHERAEKMRLEMAGITEEIKNHRAQLSAILGGRTLADFRAQFVQKIAESEKALAEAEVAREKAAQVLNSSRLRRVDLEKRECEFEADCATAEKSFAKALAASDFSDETAFLAARMPVEEFQKLSLEAADLEKKKTALNIEFAQSEGRLAELRAKKLSERPLVELRDERSILSEQHGEESRKLGAFQQQLRHDAETRQNLAEKRAQLVLQEKECARWSNLHRLIGSSDGKKFRNFAQGLTFELMVRHANRQLARMSERYQLVRAAGRPLDLEVIDAYQAGEIRSTKNLSGGESFIVSLALALGLSKMASEKVRVDSLFLDEGFGTLDEEALDTALGTLAALNSEGKLIGLISHVPALKERISTQLSLESGRNGTSVLSGPGVVGI